MASSFFVQIIVLAACLQKIGGFAVAYNLYATGGHLDTIWMRLAASRMLFLHATGGHLHVKPPVFWKHAARTFIWIKKWGTENLRDICTSKGLSINTMHGPIQSRETVPLM